MLWVDPFHLSQTGPAGAAERPGVEGIQDDWRRTRYPKDRVKDTSRARHRRDVSRPDQRKTAPGWSGFPGQNRHSMAQVTAPRHYRGIGGARLQSRLRTPYRTG